MLTDPQLKLLALLDRHEPYDARERSHVEHVRASVEREPRCFERATLPGHITGSAFIVDPVEFKVLLHHHKKLDKWLQMGGHDNGELDAALTALREAEEESGLHGLSLPEPLEILDVDVHHIPARPTEAAHQHLDVRFMLLASSSAPLQMDSAESHDLRWVPLDEVTRWLLEEGGPRVVAKIRARLERLPPSARTRFVDQSGRNASPR